MALIKNKDEIAKMRRGGMILREVLSRVASVVRDGVNGSELNELTGKLLKEKGAQPSFLNYQGFPANLCVSINEEVVHGIPDNKIVREGDIVSLDLGVNFEGMHTDAAVTVPCGQISETARRILQVTKECLRLAVLEARSGNRLGDIGYAVQSHAEKEGFAVVRRLVGHGIGYDVHEDPAVPNYGKQGEGMRLKEGMCLAIEPMLCEGSYDVVVAPDGWTFVSRDRLLTAHFEHTVVVRKKRGEIIT